MAEEKPKIIIDDDWKRQAHDEKMKLAEEEKQHDPKPASAPAQERRGARTLPPAGIDAMVSTFATQALLAMGLIEAQGMERTVNLDVAKFNIDMLSTLEEKTKGNLSPDETNLLNQTLHQLRMAFVEVTSMQSGPIG
jgi:hypothetical protein